MTDESNNSRPLANNIETNGCGNGESASDLFFERQEQLLRERRWKNRLVALALAVFCLLVFTWIIVRGASA